MGLNQPTQNWDWPWPHLVASSWQSVFCSWVLPSENESIWVGSSLSWPINERPRMGAHVHVYTYIYIYNIYIYINKHIYIYIYKTCVYTYVRIYICICICIFIYAYIYIYVYIYIHTYIHTCFTETTLYVHICTHIHHIDRLCASIFAIMRFCPFIVTPRDPTLAWNSSIAARTVSRYCNLLVVCLSHSVHSDVQGGPHMIPKSKHITCLTILIVFFGGYSYSSWGSVNQFKTVGHHLVVSCTALIGFFTLYWSAWGIRQCWANTFLSAIRCRKWANYLMSNWRHTMSKEEIKDIWHFWRHDVIGLWISAGSQLPIKVEIQTGWWFEPLWKILVNWDDYSQYMGK